MSTTRDWLDSLQLKKTQLCILCCGRAVSPVVFGDLASQCNLPLSVLRINEWTKMVEDLAWNSLLRLSHGVWFLSWLFSLPLGSFTLGETATTMKEPWGQVAQEGGWPRSHLSPEASLSWDFSWDWSLGLGLSVGHTYVPARASSDNACCSNLLSWA